MPTDPAGGSSISGNAAQPGRSSLSLNQRLDGIAAELRARNPEGAEVVDRFIARLKAACVGENAPAIDETLPPFMMPDHEGRLVTLDQQLKLGPLVLVFYRGHWCPYCRATIAALVDMHRRIAPAQIFAISAETQRYTSRIRTETGARFPFLSDMDAEYADRIGLAVTIEPPLRNVLQASGRTIPDFQGGLRWVLPVPAVFLLDKSGIIRARHVDPDYRRRMEVEDLLRAIRDLTG